MGVIPAVGRRPLSLQKVAGLLGLVLLLLAGSLQVVRGCAICAEIPGASGALGPRLLEIASAIRHEIDSGGLEQANPGAPLPTTGRVLGRRMASLLKGRSDRNRRLELLLIDSGARFRFDPSQPERGFAGVSAKSRLVAPEMRWITGLDVFHALLEGRMAVDTAEIRGILVIEPIAADDPLLARDPAPQVSGADETQVDHQPLAGPGRSGTAMLLAILAVLVLMPILLVLRSNRSNRTRMAGAGTR